MPEVDTYGKLVVDANRTEPVSAWAITKGGTIDPDWIFATKESAEIRFALQDCPLGPVLPVIVTGKGIRLA